MRTIGTDDRAGLPESSFRYNPLQHLRWVYVRFIQGLFYYCPKGAYHWEPDNDDSDIFVVDEGPVDVDTVGVRPIITLTRAPVSFYSLGFDDMVRYDPSTGQKMKSLLIPGTMSINVCSKNSIESENLAWGIAEHIWLLRDLLQREGFYDIGRNLQVGAPSPAGKVLAGDGAKEWYCTTILSPFHMQRTSQVSPLGQKLVAGFSALFNPLLPNIPQEAPTTGVPEPVVCTTSDDGLPRVPHPLNPTKMVTIRQIRPNSPIYRQPSMGATSLPIRRDCVEESDSAVGQPTTVKV